MLIRNRLVVSAVAYMVGTAGIAISPAVSADNAGAFIGGVFAAKVINNAERRTEAQETQASVAQQSQASAQKSPQQRLDELDTLAAKGYISKSEYDAKKKAILASM